MRDETMVPSGATEAILNPGGGPRTLAPRDAADVRDLVRQARETATPFRIRGGGTWLDAGRPVDARDILDVSSLSGITEYVPGDLTLTAGAGTPLAQIEAATRSDGLWLPLHPFGGDRSTLGATLATASCGPLAATIGHPRDLTLGVEFVSGVGEIVRGGGRVVKNVAGYDLVRLTVGAWGTLGVITEATVRLRALPECDVTIALDAGDEATLGRLLRSVRSAPLAAVALELIDGALARALRVGDGTGALLLARIVGNEESIAAQRAALDSLGDCIALSPDVWTLLARCEPRGSFTLRVSRRPSELVDVWTAVHAAARSADAALVHASIERGIVRCIAAAGDGRGEPLQTLLEGVRQAGTCIVERAPVSLWSDVPRPPFAGGESLSRRLQRAFDPDRLCNPGLLESAG